MRKEQYKTNLNSKNTPSVDSNPSRKRWTKDLRIAGFNPFLCALKMLLESGRPFSYTLRRPVRASCLLILIQKFSEYHSCERPQTCCHPFSKRICISFTKHSTPISRLSSGGIIFFPFSTHLCNLVFTTLASLQSLTHPTHLTYLFRHTPFTTSHLPGHGLPSPNSPFTPSTRSAISLLISTPPLTAEYVEAL